MRRAAAAALVFAFACGPTLAAAPAALEPAFRNTIVSTYPDGRQARLWLRADGTYKGQGRRGFYNGGKWSVKGQKVCLKQTTPKAYPFSYCTKIVSGGVGTKWSGKAVTGEKISIQLVAGRAGER
jgi:hypothetical protein